MEDLSQQQNLGQRYRTFLVEALNLVKMSPLDCGRLKAMCPQLDCLVYR